MTPAFQATYVVTHADATVRTSYPRVRLEAVDLLRGLLVILTVTDHTRIYFSNVHVTPTDLSLSWPVLFARRWITHLCAPGCIALAGASVYLQRQRGKSAKQTEHLLVMRGLWLLFLDVTLISFGWSFTLKAPFMNVISAIGLSLIGLGLLQRLSVRMIGMLGALIVLLHNLLDPIHAAGLGRFGISG